MVRFHRVTVPVLWFSWPGDTHFPLDCQAACYRSTPGPRMITLLPGMRHGHSPAWNPPESYAFAESIVHAGRPWCQQTGARLDTGVVHVTFSSQKDLDRAVLISTVDDGFSGNRKWSESPAGLKKQDTDWLVTAPLPQGTTAWFVNVMGGGLTASSEYQTVAIGR
jgi:hypothetical protein